MSVVIEFLEKIPDYVLAMFLLGLASLIIVLIWMAIAIWRSGQVNISISLSLSYLFTFNSYVPLQKKKKT